ncbi:excinuclease ABC subunit UvrA [Yinghuangia soli]|uniref:UvrABC system protein A n=1 Tax=Yinghuangia soli TaxID=2908204 RepID=A0AA41Q1H1_9ACTN|nr:excinuclease ABC subunit UvrA [Yinghuangia soli]MCF2528714.1 excinuclease ABC subunit UvrA [Yinghuangia soli]
MVRVRDAQEHNLDHVDVDIPRDRLVVFTGVSGSGKSSLAFATVFAESQRRFLESVAPYARRLMDQAPAPRVGDITGLPPAVALQQQRTSGSSRSSVGTVSRLSNVLRMLYSRAGTYPPGVAAMDSDSFSPNTPAGACPTCHGVGLLHTVDVDALVPDPGKSIREGAIAAWPGAWQGKNLRDILGELGVDLDAPWRELPADRRTWILTTDEQPVVTVHPVRSADRITRPYQGTYSSPQRWVRHTYATTKSAALRAKAARFLTTETCPACAGRRLNPDALRVTFAGRDITATAALPLRDLDAALRAAAEHPDTVALPAAQRDAADRLRESALGHLEALTGLGLDYLSMDRTTATLSAGELQRLRLATQLRSGLFGVLYVLDEPSAGLHPADTETLVGALDRLRAAGNSVFAVEHDLDVMARADWIVDVGPGAGVRGGRVLYSGPVDGLAAVQESATARYLTGVPAPDGAAPAGPGTAAAGWITLHDVRHHNLQGVTARFPLGRLTAVTGVSGSGKSSLVGQVLVATVRHHVGGAADESQDGPETDADHGADGPGGPTDTELAVTPVVAEGLDAVDRIVCVDQKPIGRTPRSNLATYTGLFDAVRRLFAAQPEAVARGYTAGRFSFNRPEGRCPDCQGEGVVSIEMLFLPTTSAVCPTCAGARYNPKTLEVAYRGRNIADVLALSVEDALEFLADLPAARQVLTLLERVGLGYLALGQSATTLSGGEAQRIKLAAELQRTRRGRTLYVLDEPTTGLHPADVELLLGQLRGLVDEGGTVVLVEHDMSVVARADHVVDLGPGGGRHGGTIVAAGTPAEVATATASVTAPYLAAALARLAPGPGAGVAAGPRPRPAPGARRPRGPRPPPPRRRVSARAAAGCASARCGGRRSPRRRRPGRAGRCHRTHGPRRSGRPACRCRPWCPSAR